MKIYLLNAHTLSETAIEELAKTLPLFRAETVARCRRRDGYVQGVAGFCLVRYALKQLDPHVDTESWEFAENGKPRLTAGTPFFNLSHTAHCIAVAVSESEEIGIDIEEIKPRSRGLAEKFCSKEEQAAILAAPDPTSETIRLWSAKEAEAKRTGAGIGKGIRDIPLGSVKSLPLTAGGVPHWLSVSPADQTPLITWVDSADLL